MQQRLVPNIIIFYLECFVYTSPGFIMWNPALFYCFYFTLCVFISFLHYGFVIATKGYIQLFWFARNSIQRGSTHFNRNDVRKNNTISLFNITIEKLCIQSKKINK